MREFIAVTKALADKNRVRALLALRGRELCLCQLVELIGLAPSTVSKHMTVLKQARLVAGRKEGRWMYYRLGDDQAPAAAREAVDWACRSLARDPIVKEDAKRLKVILKLDLDTLCKRLHRS